MPPDPGPSVNGPTRKEPNTFAKLNIPVGTVLELIRDSKVKIIVHDDQNKVRCLDDNQVLSISSAATKYHPKGSSQNGWQHFRRAGENKPLYERPRTVEPHYQRPAPEMNLVLQEDLNPE